MQANINESDYGTVTTVHCAIGHVTNNSESQIVTCRQVDKVGEWNVRGCVRKYQIIECQRRTVRKYYTFKELNRVEREPLRYCKGNGKTRNP